MSNIVVGTPEWLAARREFITATDMPVIMGVSKWKTLAQLCNEKIYGVESKQNNAMKRGLDMEDEARRAFESEIGSFVFPKFMTKDDWMAASLDGINEKIAVEIKCSGEVDHHIALDGIVPKHYIPQLQWQMNVAELDDISYWSYRPLDPHPHALIRVERNEEYITDMKVKGREVWEMIKRKKPPESDFNFIDDAEFSDAEDRLALLLSMHNSNKDEIEYLRNILINKCNGKKSSGKYIRLCPIQSKGKIDYSSIPQLKEVDLESFRKPTTISWRVDLIN